MGGSKQSTQNNGGLEDLSKVSKSESRKKKSKVSSSQSSMNSNDGKEEVVFNLPAGVKYTLPGKRQRVILGSLVVGLNLILVIAVIAYFYIPSFQDFIYNVGRN
tara:strand:- start:391 stop:702 length:312 start_codon:yes stop_codon:yes gene_type:complete